MIGINYELNEIGNRIYIARKNKGLKQSDIYLSLGISQSSYSNIENGKTDITISTLLALSDILDVSISWLTDRINTELNEKDLLDLETFKQFLMSRHKQN